MFKKPTLDKLPTGLLNDHAMVLDGTVLSARTLGPRLRTRVATLASSKQLAQKSHDAWNLGRREEGHDVLRSVAASTKGLVSIDRSTEEHHLTSPTFAHCFAAL
jgi:hypothetical protein